MSVPAGTNSVERISPANSFRLSRPFVPKKERSRRRGGTNGPEERCFGMKSAERWNELRRENLSGEFVPPVEAVRSERGTISSERWNKRPEERCFGMKSAERWNELRRENLPEQFVPYARLNVKTVYIARGRSRNDLRALRRPRDVSSKPLASSALVIRRRLTAAAGP
jgi:hypothetical protein